MCGRFGLISSLEELEDYFALIESLPAEPEMPARYNIAPTQPVVVVRSNHNGTGREGIFARWGLVPAWVDDPKSFPLVINARVETVAEKPSFRAAIRHRRILIPASGFYEWRRFGKGVKSHPYWVKPKDDALVAFGGVMETWLGANGSEIDTVCILTTPANQTFEEIHHRLPLVIKQENFDRWLDPQVQDPADIADLFMTVEDDYFEMVRVGDAVNKVSNDNPSIQEPYDPDEQHEPVTHFVPDEQMSLF